MSAAPSNCVIVGTGRAGEAFARALGSSGWDVASFSGRSLTNAPEAPDDFVAAVAGADVVLIAVADGAIAEVAAVVPPTPAAVVHVSGAAGLDVLAPHGRVGSVHPLMSLPDGVRGAERLLDGCTFAVDGDPVVADLVAALGGRSVAVPGPRRALYHAAAAVAANHLVALCGQVERLAAAVGVDADAYWAMMSATIDNVTASGPAAALTGPAARADWTTIRAHLAALPPHERPLYLALFHEAAALAGQAPPDDLR